MRIVFTLSLFLMVCVSPVMAGDWPNWRGPNQDGVASGKNYPTEWSVEKNVAWKVELPGKGSSTPAVWGDRIFVTSAADGKNALLAFDRHGKEAWRVIVGAERPGKNKKASGSNPSCVTDGQHVYAYFKSGDLACVDFAGKIVWQTNLQKEYGEDTLWWDLGTSPVLTKDAVVIACMHSGPSYVAAFSKADGSVLWKQDRDLGAPEEAAQSYATPVVVDEVSGQVIVVLGADHVTAHDAASGKEIWRVGGLNPTNHKYFRSIASAAVSDGMVIAPYARGESLTAIKMGGQGDVTSSHISWFNQVTSGDVPTPAIANGRVFICRDGGEARGTIDCLDLLTGKTIWSGQLPKNRSTYRSSPTVADGKLYVARQDSTVFVLDAMGSEFKVLGQNTIAEEHTVATPVCVDGKIILRTDSHVYLIGNNG